MRKTPKTPEKPLLQPRDNDMEEMNDCLRLSIMKNNINNLENDMGQNEGRIKKGNFRSENV